MEILLVLTLTDSQGKKQFKSIVKDDFIFSPWAGKELGIYQPAFNTGLEDELIIKAKELILREQKFKIRKALRQNK